MKKRIFIGGAPTVGKSYITKRLSKDFHLPWISTDSVRGMMREIVNRNQYLDLFRLDMSNKYAGRYLSSHSVNKIIEDHNGESKDVWKGVRAILKTDHVWNDFIVEGVAVLPEFIARLKHDDCIIDALFLTVSSEEKVREVVYKEGMWNGSVDFDGDVMEKQIEWILEYDRYISEEAIRYGFKVFKTGTNEKQTTSCYNDIISLVKLGRY
jgi:2-phosphoglycerate kinase